MSDMITAIRACWTFLCVYLGATEAFASVAFSTMGELETMSNPEEIALLRIKKVRESSTDKLDLSSLDLVRVPAEVVELDQLRALDLSYNTDLEDITFVSKLTRLESLDVSNTRVGDLFPVARLRNLGSISFWQTQVSDLGPLANLRHLNRLDAAYTGIDNLRPLSEIGTLRSLNFKNSQLADFRPLAKSVMSASAKSEEFLIEQFDWDDFDQLDPEGGRILRQFGWPRLMEYLQDIGDAEYDRRIARWRHESYQNSATRTGVLRRPPDDTFAAPSYVVAYGKPAFSVSTHVEEFGSEQLVLQEEVRRKAALLANATEFSNEHFVLNQFAKHYLAQVEREIADIDVRSLWSAANSLRSAMLENDRAQELGQEGYVLPTPISIALTDLVETHGAFIMGFSEAVGLENKMRSYLTGKRDLEVRRLVKDITAELASNAGALSLSDLASLQDDVAAMDSSGESGELAEISARSKIWNLVCAFGRKIWVAVKSGTKLIMRTLAIEFVKSILRIAQTVQDFINYVQQSGAEWFAALVEKIKDLL